MRIARPGHAEASSLRDPMARRRVLRRQTTTATVQAIPTTAALMSRRNVRSVIPRPTTTTAAIRSRARTIHLLRVPTRSHELIPRRAAAIPLLHALTPPPAVAIAVVVAAVAVAAAVVAVVAAVVVAARTAAEAPARTPGTNRLSCVKRPAQTFPAGFCFSDADCSQVPGSVTLPAFQFPVAPRPPQLFRPASVRWSEAIR